MFTGIIKKTAQVKKSESTALGATLLVANPGLRAKLGDSITVNGVCSTVATISKGLGFQYMPETLSRSTVGNLKVGDVVNLEQSLKAADRLDGHIVMGHVDTVGQVSAIVDEGNSKVFTIKPREPEQFMKFLAEKGSVSVDGVSLTIASVSKNSFVVKLVPYTWEHTAFQYKKIGSQVNLEFDILAKYIERLNLSHK